MKKPRYWCNLNKGDCFSFRRKYSSLCKSLNSKNEEVFFTAISLYSSHPEHTPSLETMGGPRETNLRVAPHLKRLTWKNVLDYGHDKSGRLDLPGIGVGGTVIKYLYSTDTQ